MNRKRFNQLVFSTVSGLAALSMLASLASASGRIDIPGPPGSDAFGTFLNVLPNGNLVVCDPGYDAGSITDVGAAYLYDGVTGALISTLTGSTAGDQVCFPGIAVLANGNFLISSTKWDNGNLADAGAVTWASGATGVSGFVSPENSLVGGSAYDQIGSDLWGSGSTWPLANGNYLVLSPYWNGTAGAVTWGNGQTGITGTVSAANSLVGSNYGDQVGVYGIVELANGNYLVRSPWWNHLSGAITWADGDMGISGPVSEANSLVGVTSGDSTGEPGRVTALANGNYLVFSPAWNQNAGAVTWGNGAAGITGVVSAANSLVGSASGDQIGFYGAVELANGNYLVSSPHWNNDAGSITWADAGSSITGTIGAANSLVGSTPGDQVGNVLELFDGNYLVLSPSWHNGPTVDAGAVTWGSGASGITGTVSAANSLVGSFAGDRVGSGYLRQDLETQNYLVLSPNWNHGAGAVTWVDSTAWGSGPISAANSLVGSTPGDQVGKNVWMLGDGNCLVGSPSWDNGSVVDAGAVTWIDSRIGITGPVSATNSLVGSFSRDVIGMDFSWVTALENGNFVVSSPFWNNSTGAVTWSSGAAGITGTISAANSLVGSQSGDMVGSSGVTDLANGNYVVSSPNWHNGAAGAAGAVTWGNGKTGITGAVSATNSLVGSTANDQIGSNYVRYLSNGNYIVCSPGWDNGSIADVGAVTWGDGMTGITGTISPTNSLVGSRVGDRVGYDCGGYLANGNYLVTSSYWDNGELTDAGAVTWGDGSTGITGAVSAANSLVGSHTGDQIGNYGSIALSNGNYLVFSPYWDDDSAVDAGAVTWGDGTTGVKGTISAANSLVGSSSGDQVGLGNYGSSGLTLLDSGDYVMSNPYWDNGSVEDVGAVTWGSGTSGVRGTISSANSVLGTTSNRGASIWYLYEDRNDLLVVGRPADNTVTLFRPNLPPLADAGWPSSVERGALVRLDGSASYDPDGNLPLQYEWTQTGGPPVSLSDPHAISPTFTAPDERTVLTFNLVVADALGSHSQPSKTIVFVDPYQYFWPLVPEH